MLSSSYVAKANMKWDATFKLIGAILGSFAPHCHDGFSSKLRADDTWIFSAASELLATRASVPNAELHLRLNCPWLSLSLSQCNFNLPWASFTYFQTGRNQAIFLRLGVALKLNRSCYGIAPGIFKCDWKTASPSLFTARAAGR